MIEKLNNLVKGYDDLSERMSDPTVLANIKEYTKLAKEHRRLNNIIHKAKSYIAIYKQIQDDEEILKGDDRELKEIVKDELSSLKDKLEILNQDLKI